jgi:hypothetical protein
MEKIQKYKLIDGQFSPSDSINILFALFNSKINFHQLESFRIQEINSDNKKFIQHNQRALELKEAYLLLKSVANDAEKKNMEIKIHGNIEIKQVKKKKL